jgi:hypothetical protein
MLDGRPSKVEPLVITNEEERELFKIGEKKYLEIQKKRFKQ